MSDLWVRADATPTTGAGHVMRCAALAEAWTAGTRRFWGSIEIDFVRAALCDAGFEAATEAAELTSASVLVVDTYDSVERDRCARCRDAGARVLVDDVG